MKKHLFTWLLVILGIASAFAQKNENDTTHYCGTPNLPRSEMQKQPWYGNNQFLYDFSYISKKIKQSMKKLYSLIFSFLYFNFNHLIF